LRQLLLASASADRPRADLNGSELTVGKHEVSSEDLRARMAGAKNEMARQFTVLSDAYVHAIASIEGGSPAEAVDDLLRAGRSEESIGRVSRACEWYMSALRLAEGLRDRRPESAAQLALARVNLRIGLTDDAARAYTRSLNLAEADGDWGAEIRACAGLAQVETVRGLDGAAIAWYMRAIQRAEATNDESRIGSLRISLARSFHRARKFDAGLAELREARASFEDLGGTRDIVRALCIQGEIERDRNQFEESAATYREALAWAYGTDGKDSLVVRVRLGMANLQRRLERWGEAEMNLREAERFAVAGGHVGWLVQIYTDLGSLRGMLSDGDAFIFFEQALELLRTLSVSPMFEARIYIAYGAFKDHIGQSAEARAYFDRAHQLLSTVGATVEADAILERVLRVDGG
jgi:tetratricopeptide (TPR) repeat protein